MEEIVNRLHENRQIQLAKEILESNGYKVSKKTLREEFSLSAEEIDQSLEYLKERMISISELLDNYGGKEKFAQEREGTDELDIPCQMLQGNYNNVYTIADEDEGGREVLELFKELDRKDIKKQDIPGVGYCILVDTELGQFVYQNQWGMEVLFKKF